MTDRYPLDLYVEVDPQIVEGQARARVVARIMTPDGVTQIERTLFSEVVYDYPDERRGAERNIVLLFSEALRDLLEKP
jgi:hypothetical protein